MVIDDNEAIHADFKKVFGGSSAHDDQLDALEAELFGDDAPARAATPARPPLQVDVASQGRQGIAMVEAALARGVPYHLVFVDVRMPPGIDGIETAEYLWERDPTLRIVICTAYSDYGWDEIRSRLTRHEQLMILRKPFDVAEVRDLVELRWG